MNPGEKKEKRKEEIFKAAVRCFNKAGFYRTTIDTIAARAKISKGGIYYHFKSKEELFIELFQYRVNKYFEQIRAYIKEEHDPEERLRLFVKKASQILKENEDFFRFSLEFLSMGTRVSRIRKSTTTFYQDSVENFTRLIEDGIIAGRFKTSAPEKIARIIYFLFMGIFFTYYSVNVDFDIIEQHCFNIDTIITAITSSDIVKK